MLEGDVVLNPSQKDWDCIEGYISNTECHVCTYPIFVKTGYVELDSRTTNFPPRFRWYLCHICFDRGWKIPSIHIDGKKLLYFNDKTNETKFVDCLGER